MQIYLVMIEEMLAQMCSNLNTQYLQRVKKWPPLISMHYLINKDSHCVENWSCKGNFQKRPTKMPFCFERKEVILFFLHVFIAWHF